MNLSAAILNRLAALDMPAEAFREVLAILAEMQGADDARRERQKNRKRKSRDKSRDSPVTNTELSRDGSVTKSPPHPLKKEDLPDPEPNGSVSGKTRAELERDLFKRGRQVCGKNAGGLINALLKAKQFDVALARSVIEMAATKDDPREFVAAAVRNPANGKYPHRQSLSDAADDLIARAEASEHRIARDEGIEF